jgi:hypothetical protein
MSPSILTPGGISSAMRSYFDSLGRLTSFVVGFLGDTYTLGKFPTLRSYAFALGISFCTCIDACFVHVFSVCDVDALAFGGAMDFCSLAMCVIHSALCSL